MVVLCACCLLGCTAEAFGTLFIVTLGPAELSLESFSVLLTEVSGDLVVRPWSRRKEDLPHPERPEHFGRAPTRCALLMASRLSSWVILRAWEPDC